MAWHGNDSHNRRQLNSSMNYYYRMITVSGNRAQRRRNTVSKTPPHSVSPAFSNTPTKQSKNKYSSKGKGQ